MPVVSVPSSPKGFADREHFWPTCSASGIAEMQHRQFSPGLILTRPRWFSRVSGQEDCSLVDVALFQVTWILPSLAARALLVSIRPSLH